jgi:hypothetical protein
MRSVTLPDSDRDVTVGVNLKYGVSVTLTITLASFKDGASLPSTCCVS